MGVWDANLHITTSTLTYWRWKLVQGLRLARVRNRGDVYNPIYFERCPALPIDRFKPTSYQKVASIPKTASFLFVYNHWLSLGLSGMGWGEVGGLNITSHDFNFILNKAHPTLCYFCVINVKLSNSQERPVVNHLSIINYRNRTVFL